MVSEMSNVKQPNKLVKDLFGQMARTVSGTRSRSFGIVGATVESPRIPEHCLRACLNNDAANVDTQGCRWLRAAVAGQLSDDIQADRCEQGYKIAVQATECVCGSGLILAIEDDTSTLAQEDSPEEVLTGLESLSSMLTRVSQLLDENEGLADEVLRNYEQLNLIFGFTQQIVNLTDTDAIERALLSRLGESLAANTVMEVKASGEYRCYDVPSGEWVSMGDASVLNEQLTREIEVARQSRGLSVTTTDTALIAFGTLTRLDDKVDVVLAMRALDSGEFNSGDMLMIESILAFGGQIISNAEIQERLRRMSFESTRALVAAIDKKDHYTCGHSERVGYLSRLVGEGMGLPSNELKILEMSGLLHDVGKIGIPEGILCKPGKLTDDEYETIKSHPRMGYEILKPIASFEEVLNGVLYHHENPDGTGYPEGLSGDQIALFARIIHVVDVFDALTSTRSYRVAFSVEQACEILRKESGTKLDGEVTEIFLRLLPEFIENHPTAFAAAFSPALEVADA